MGARDDTPLDPYARFVIGLLATLSYPTAGRDPGYQAPTVGDG
jgi:hypothetical protein